MAKCMYGEKFNSNLDDLNDTVFDEFLDHTNECVFCLTRIIEYEKSLLPVLRAALPEKIISSRPMPSKVFIPARLINEIGAAFRKLSIEFALLIRQIIRSGQLEVKNLGYILIWLVTGGFIVYATVLYILPNIDHNTPSLQSEPQKYTESSKKDTSQTQQPSNQFTYLRFVDKAAQQNNKKGSRSKSSDRFPKHQVVISFDTPQTTDEDNKAHKKSKVETQVVKSGDANEKQVEKSYGDFQKELNNPSLPMESDQQIKNNASAFRLVNIFADPQDTLSAQIKLKVKNLTALEIDKTICSVNLIDSPKLITTFTMKLNGNCEAGFRVGYKYIITVETPGYSPKQVHINVLTNKMQVILVNLTHDLR